MSKRSRQRQKLKREKPAELVVDLQAAAMSDDEMARLAFERADRWAKSVDGAAYGCVDMNGDEAR